MRLKYLLPITFCVAVFSVSAQSLEDLKRKESFDQAIDLINRAEILLESASRQRRTDCAKAVGDLPLCECLDENLAVAWSFADYVAIVTRTKEENGYDAIDPKLRPAYDNVAMVRDACVAASVAP